MRELLPYEYNDQVLEYLCRLKCKYTFTMFNFNI